MKLRDRFRTDTKAANDGVWVDFPEYHNGDGTPATYEEDGKTIKTEAVPHTVPGFKIARKSNHNTEYAKAMREVTKSVNTDEGVKSYEDLTEEQAEAVELDIFVTTLLMGWRNFQPITDGENMPFTEDNARKIFGDIDWRDLRSTLSIRSGQATNYAYNKEEVEVKNS